ADAAAVVFQSKPSRIEIARRYGIREGEVRRVRSVASRNHHGGKGSGREEDVRSSRPIGDVPADVHQQDAVCPRSVPSPEGRRGGKRLTGSAHPQLNRLRVGGSVDSADDLLHLHYMEGRVAGTYHGD